MRWFRFLVAITSYPTFISHISTYSCHFWFRLFSAIDFEAYVFHLSTFIYDNRYRADDSIDSLWLLASLSDKSNNKMPNERKYLRLMFTIRLMRNMRISFVYLAILHTKRNLCFTFYFDSKECEWPLQVCGYFPTFTANLCEAYIPHRLEFVKK